MKPYSMSPEMQQIKALEARVKELENATNPSFVAELLRRISGVKITATESASLAGMTISVRDSSDTTTETVADDYDGTLVFNIGGNNYRVGFYN